MGMIRAPCVEKATKHNDMLMVIKMLRTLRKDRWRASTGWKIGMDIDISILQSLGDSKKPHGKADSK